MEKILTVVVPTYNMEKYLDRCLSSLIVDDDIMDKLEVIVVNDGSRDKSSEIAHSYQQNYPESFIVIDKENGNYGSCVNVGLNVSTGKYFRILDADDWFKKDALVCLLNKLSECNSDLIVTTLREIGDAVFVENLSPDVIPGIQYEIDNLNENNVILSMHSMTYSMDILHKCKLHLSEGVSYSDSEYCFFPIPYVKTVTFIDQELYQYNSSREGQTTSPSSLVRSIGSMSCVANRIFDYYTDNISFQTDFAAGLWLRMLKQISALFYNTVLTLCKKTEEISASLRYYDNKVQNVPELDNYLVHFCRHHIYYVKRWRYTGRYYTSPLCRIHNFVWELLDPVWLFLLRKIIPCRR